LQETIIRLGVEAAGADAVRTRTADLDAADICKAVTKPVNFMVGIKGNPSVSELRLRVRRISLATSSIVQQ
jgi:hypothetical protein